MKIRSSERYAAALVNESKSIRIFISSTFIDMQDEREELVKRVFPQLRRICEERGVTWGEVDLRWGITDEQRSEGKVLPICLAEINNCRPYFIGILGERYGWIPEGIEPSLIEEEPWLKEHLSHSVTELEIVHGVLNNPDMADHALFYFRDPSYIDTLPDEKRSLYKEGPTSQELDQFGEEEACRRAQDRKAKLAALKDRIRESGFPRTECYKDSRELGEIVEKDLRSLTDRLFPEAQVPDLLASEALLHEAYARSRFAGYVPRRDYEQQLENNVRSNGPPLVILGESGIGKSALMANWATSYKGPEPLIMHFIGAASESSDWAAMVRRIMGELMKAFKIEAEIPSREDELPLSFENLLRIASTKGKAIILIDALDQLEERPGALDLIWLPFVIPENIRLVLSTLPGIPQVKLEERGWPTLTLESLEEEEKREIIRQYLSLYTKALTSSQMATLASAPQTDNPLFLLALLEELRVHGVQDTLEERISHYLGAKDPRELYSLILERYEADYDRDRPFLVRDSMCLIWAARRGLSESELADLLGSDDEPMPIAYWSPLYVNARQSLCSRSGLVGFFHRYMRDAVERRYLPSDEEKIKRHRQLAEYFLARPISPRKVEELPWEFAKCRLWLRLFDLLSDLEFFPLAWQTNRLDVISFWEKIESNSNLKMTQAYEFAENENPLEYHSYASWIMSLFGRRGCYKDMLPTLDGQIELHERMKESDQMCFDFGRKGDALFELCDFNDAISCYDEEERLARELGLHDRIAHAIWGKANIHYCRNNYRKALKLLGKSELTPLRTENPSFDARCTGLKASILYKKGDWKRALKLNREAEQIFRSTDDPEGLVACLGSQGIILRDKEPEKAMRLHKEQEAICRGIDFKTELQSSLGDQGTLLCDKHQLEAALALFEEQERICNDIDVKDGLAICLGNQALVYAEWGKYKRAQCLNNKKIDLCKKMGMKEELARSLRMKVVISLRLEEE